MEGATLIQHDFHIITTWLKGGVKEQFEGSFGDDERIVNSWRILYTWLKHMVAFLTFISPENASLFHLS